MAYNPLACVYNATDADMLNVTLYHVWPQGQTAASYFLGTVSAGLQGQTCQLQSGAGPGSDYFTLTFNFPTGGVQAMPPTVANIGALNTPSSTVAFIVAPTEVEIQNTIYLDVVALWGPACTLGFLSQGVTNAVVDKSDMVPKAGALAAEE